MNLLFINQALSFGGAEVFNIDLLAALKKEEELQISAIANNKELIKLLAKAKIPTIETQLEVDLVGNWKGLLKAIVYAPLLSFFYWQQIKKLSKKPDMILMTGFNEKIIATPIAKLLGIKVIWIEFGSLEPLFEKFVDLPKLLYGLVKNYPSKIIVPSKNTQEKISYLFPKEKITLIPCGRKLKEPVRKKSTNNKQKLVCVSRLEKGKGQDYLIRAFTLLKKDFPNLELRIVGHGAFLKELQLLQKELQVKDLIFTGRVPNALEELNNAKICIFPSVWDLEGFGLVAIEAMFLGKSIVGFNRPPSNEILKNGKNALLAKDKSVKDLSKQIAELLNNPQLAKKLAKQAQKDFQEKYQIKAVAKKYLQALQRS